MKYQDANPRANSLRMYALGLTAIFLIGFIVVVGFFALAPQIGLSADKPVLVQNRPPQFADHKEISMPSVRFDGGQRETSNLRILRGADN